MQPESTGGWIGNDKNSGMEHSRSENGRTALDALYNTTPIVTTRFEKEVSAACLKALSRQSPRVTEEDN
jgi:hypothetical protein